MRGRVILALAAAGAFTLGGCQEILEGSGVSASEERDVRGFNRIALAVPGSVELLQGDAEGVLVEGDDNIVQAVETLVRGGTLHVRPIEAVRNVAFRPSTPLRIRVDVRELSGVQVSGSGDAYAPSLETNRLSLTVSGSGDVFVRELAALEVAVTVSGSGSVTLGGSAIRQSVTVSGSGSYDGRALETKSAEVAVSGSGNALVNPGGELVAAVTGSGSVRYLGDPAVTEQVSGSGSVAPLGRPDSL